MSYSDSDSDSGSELAEEYGAPESTPGGAHNSNSVPKSSLPSLFESVADLSDADARGTGLPAHHAFTRSNLFEKHPQIGMASFKP
jgi:hypothetical protein